jgi:pimeloyl-ACP methyl ester carboxylesterase
MGGPFGVVTNAARTIRYEQRPRGACPKRAIAGAGRPRHTTVMARWLETMVGVVLAISPTACGGERLDPDAGLPDADASVSGDAGADADVGCTPSAAFVESVAVEGMLGSLGGTLEVPAGCGPFAVAVILSGSGSTDRNGNDPVDGAGPDNYHLLAQALRDAGIATLRYDDHGVGESASAAPLDVRDFSFDLEIEDAGRWATTLREDPLFDRVLFAGHSQGSLTALVAGQRVSVDGVVSLDGTALRAGRLLIEQVRPRATPEELAALEDAVAELEAGRTVDGLPPRIAAILDPSVQPYLISWFAYDPMEEMARTSFPILVVHGTTDQQVPIEHASLLAGVREGTELALIEDMAHSLKHAGVDPLSQRAAVTDKTVPLADGLAARIAEFVVLIPSP